MIKVDIPLIHRLQAIKERGIVSEIEDAEVQACAMQHVDSETWVFPPLRVCVVYHQGCQQGGLSNSNLQTAVLGIWLKLISLLEGAIFSPG